MPSRPWRVIGPFDMKDRTFGTEERALGAALAFLVHADIGAEAWVYNMNVLRLVCKRMPAHEVHCRIVRGTA